MDMKYKNVASVYDLVYGSRTQDVDFYVQAAAQADPRHIAELGCGTGRVTLSLAEKMPGTRITAIDMDADEIEVLKDSARSQHIGNIETRCEQIQSFQSEDVDVAVAPFRVFQHVLELADLEDCFRSVAQSMKPGGLFYFDLFNPSIPMLARQGLINSQTFEDEDGFRIERLVNVNDQDYFRQTQLIEEDYVVTTPTGESYDLHWHYRTRYYFLGEVVPLARAAGFKILRVDSDFRGTPYGEGEYPGDLVFHLVRED